MDERRRTISSEEQMIGEALMRVSNTLEAQRLTKSLDYQEKLRSRSNIRLIIAVICLFTAMMMMMISGALLFVLWRYADPVLDTVMPFLKGAMADFGVIWDGLMETLSYVPVMVEQLTRLLEQVIIMLEGINAIDLAGIMSKLGGMLDDLLGGLQPMMEKIGDLMNSLFDGGITEFLEQLGMNPETVQKLVAGIDNLLDSTASALAGFAGQINADDAAALAQSIGDAINAVAEGLGDIKSDDVKEVVAGGSKLLNGLSSALTEIGGGLDDISSDDVAAVVDGGHNLLQGLGVALSKLGETLEDFSENGLSALF